MNDLEQAIAYHERKVKALKSAMPCDRCPIDECSEEHRQLAEWLRELQIYRKKLTEIEEAVDFYKGCESCQGFREYPTDKFVEDLVRILEVNVDEDSN